MAKSGFVPAWMKIPSSDKTNGNQKLNRSETNSTSSSPPIITGRNKSNEQQQTLNDFDGQSDGFFSFSSPHTQSRRSYSRERSSNSFAKNSELNGNGYRSINNSQRRLHSVSSYPNDRQSSNIRNGDPEKLYGTNDNDPIGFDRLEQDFPSLNGRDKNDSSSNDQSSSVWNNAASKFRTSHNEPFNLLNNSRTNRILTRKDRLLNTLNGTSSITNRSITLDLQTNYKTQTKNLDKRSDFFNSLKNDSTNEGNKHQTTKIPTNSDRNYKTTKGTLLLLSVPETPEEKEFLIRMGWNDCDEITYEITDKDKEEYEKRIQLLPKTDNTSAALMSALHRRALPCIDIQDLLRFEMVSSTSSSSSSSDDNESSDE